MGGSTLVMINLLSVEIVSAVQIITVYLTLFRG